MSADQGDGSAARSLLYKLSPQIVNVLKYLWGFVDIPFVIDPGITAGCRQFDFHDHKKVARHLKGAVENVRRFRSGAADENPFAL